MSNVEGARGLRTLVVGAGVAGLAVARALRRVGAEVEVVERAPVIGDDGLGIFLPANAVRALRLLGLDAPGDHLAGVERQRVADRWGQVLYEVDTAQLWNGIGPCRGVSRAALRRVLLEGAGDVPIRWGTGVRQVVVDGDTATVTFTDGGEGRYDLVIGADGVHSTVRELVFGAGGVRTTGLEGLRWLGPRHCDEQVRYILLGHGTSFLTVPISPSTAYYYCDTSNAARPAAEILTGIDAPILAFVSAEKVHRGPIEEVVLPSWSRGPVLLIGDAAHAMRPNIAQGAAMAMEDALVLAAALRHAGSVPVALNAYETRRRPRVEWTQRRIRRRDRARAAPPALRDPLLRAVGERLLRADHQGLTTLP